MRTWHLGKLIELQYLKPSKEEKIAALSMLYEGTENGTHEHNLRMEILNDGALSISDAGDFQSGHIYLYPEQVEHLAALLNQAAKQVKKEEGK